MVTKFNGPLLEDYMRALKAGKKMGAKAVRVELPGGYTFAFLLDEAADAGLAKQIAAGRLREEAKPANSSPTPARTGRINPMWERWSNDPEQIRLRREAEDLNSRMLQMRREPRQPNGRMTTYAQLRATSPEFRRLEEERDKLDRAIRPEPPRFLPDDVEPQEPHKPKHHW